MEGVPQGFPDAVALTPPGHGDNGNNPVTTSKFASKPVVSNREVAESGYQTPKGPRPMAGGPPPWLTVFGYRRRRAMTPPVSPATATAASPATVANSPKELPPSSEVPLPVAGGLGVGEG